MNAEIRFDGPAFAFDPRQERFFRVAVALSVIFHAAGFLTSPYWQSQPPAREEVMQVDIADVPESALPPIPRLPVEQPYAPKVEKTTAAPVPEKAAPSPEPPPPPTREMIREKVATRGVLKMLGARPGDGGAPGDPLSGIKIPRDVRVASRPPGTDSYAPSGSDEGTPVSAKVKEPGIARQVASASKSSTALSSKIFRTDSGLDAEISGGIDDQNRSAQSIAAAIRQYQSGIRYAYNKELISNPALGGRITVAFVILPEGSVESVEIRQTSMNWPPLEDAVRKRMLYWRFPKSGGAPVRVVFPFVFHPEM